MTSPQKPEHASTYYVQDRANMQELARLIAQDRMMTASMGGVLPEQADPASLRRVLDVGCGTGGWLLEAAKQYPALEYLAGVDISGKMLEHAREQAALHQVQDRVEFRVMDALRMLEFPDHHFDLVNLRFGISFVRTWEWPKIIQEMRRVTRFKGIVRIADTDIITSTSAMLTHIMLDIGLPASIHAGNAFGKEPGSMARELTSLLSRQNFNLIHQQDYPIVYHAGSDMHHLFVEDISKMLRLAPDFWRKWIRVPDNYEELYQQMLREIQQPDFEASWPLFTLWSNVE
ncbi:MAG TPA: class I SAM-dependent methyltransferase [Ktedonobacteraceae bacterium]